MTVPGLYLTVGDPEGFHVTFGPLSPKIPDRTMKPFFDLDSIESPIVITAPSGNWYLEERNGIEPRALAQFRTDIGTLREAGRGAVFFGDHDFNQIVDLELLRSNTIHVVANNAADGIFDIKIGEYPVSIIEDLIQQVDLVEKRLGPLVGHCKGCGPSISGFHHKGGYFTN